MTRPANLVPGREEAKREVLAEDLLKEKEKETTDDE